MFRWLAGLAALTGIALSTQSQAIVANPEPRLCSAWTNADAVVVGRVGQSRFSDDGAIVQWPVEVERTYKGNVPKKIVVTSENTSARGTPDEGRRNILFLHTSQGRYEIWGSDPNYGGARLRSMEADARRLAKAKPRSTGSVDVLIADENGAIRPGFAVRFVKTHGDLRLMRFSDATGHVLVDLPAGNWTAQVAKHGWSSRESIYSYTPSDTFEVRPGGCVDLRLAPFRN